MPLLVLFAEVGAYVPLLLDLDEVGDSEEVGAYVPLFVDLADVGA